LTAAAAAGAAATTAVGAAQLIAIAVGVRVELITIHQLTLLLTQAETSGASGGSGWGICRVIDNIRCIEISEVAFGAGVMSRLRGRRTVATHTVGKAEGEGRRESARGRQKG
jgi:hypothetical protein